MTTTTGAAAMAAPIQFGRVVGATFGALRQNIGPYLILAAIFSGLPNLVFDTLFAAAPNAGDRMDAFRMTYLKAGLEGVFTYPLIAGVILGVAAYAKGARLSFEDCWSGGLKAWGSLFALGFVKGLRIGIGLLLLIVPGVIWALMWAVALPVRMIENRPLSASLTRSSVLTKGRRWPIVGLVLLYAVGIIVVGVIVGLVAGALIGVFKPMGLPFTGAIQQIASAIVSMATDLVGAAGVACLYFELKTTREGDEPTEVAAVFA